VTFSREVRMWDTTMHLSAIVASSLSIRLLFTAFNALGESDSRLG
jgi:hypothetical protein